MIRKELLSVTMSRISSLDQGRSRIPDQVSRAHVLSLELCLSWAVGDGVGMGTISREVGVQSRANIHEDVPVASRVPAVGPSHRAAALTLASGTIDSLQKLPSKGAWPL